MHPEIHSWAEAQTFHEGARRTSDGSAPRARKIAPNVLLVETIGIQGRAYSIRLYENDLITYYPDGTFSADNGGWNTPTTMKWLRVFAPRGWSFEHRDRILYALGPNAQRYPADALVRFQIPHTTE